MVVDTTPCWSYPMKNLVWRIGIFRREVTWSWRSICYSIDENGELREPSALVELRRQAPGGVSSLSPGLQTKTSLSGKESILTTATL